MLDLCIVPPESAQHQNFIHQAQQIEWRSSFDFILRDENAKQTFLNCECAPIKIAASTAKTVNYTEFESASRSWKSVDRRIRDAILRLVHKQSIMDFIVAIEWLLSSFADHGSFPAQHELPLVLLAQVDGPITVSANHDLSLSLEESPCHRLLLHAICRYHGFVSKVRMTILALAALRDVAE